MTTTDARKRLAEKRAAAQVCDCPPCPGRGNDGHGMTHCAECCFVTGVDADPDCPTHGERAAAQPDTDERKGCPSCDRDLSYPGAPGHECYTYAEKRAAEAERDRLRAQAEADVFEEDQ